jgi:archaellum biogenesis ATPase FlaH
MDKKLPSNDSNSGINNEAAKVDDSTTNTKSTTKFTLPQELPKLPSLKESIQEFVLHTNQMLTSLEVKYQESIRKPMTQAVHQVSDTTTAINEQVQLLHNWIHLITVYPTGSQAISVKLSYR